jgi:hypothetical protein
MERKTLFEHVVMRLAFEGGRELFRAMVLKPCQTVSIALTQVGELREFRVTITRKPQTVARLLGFDLGIYAPESQYFSVDGRIWINGDGERVAPDYSDWLTEVVSREPA